MGGFSSSGGWRTAIAGNRRVWAEDVPDSLTLHTVLDDKIYRKGMRDFQADIDAATRGLDWENDPEAYDKLEALKSFHIAAEAVILFAQRHAELAEEQAVQEADPIRRDELRKIAATCRQVPARVASTDVLPARVPTELRPASACCTYDPTLPERTDGGTRATISPAGPWIAPVTIHDPASTLQKSARRCTILVRANCARAACRATEWGARRTADTAAWLVDSLLPEAGYRQWVLTFPYTMRFRLAADRHLLSTLLRVFLQVLFACRALEGGQRRRGRTIGIADGHTGTVSFIQRYGSALNSHVHCHCILPDGLFVPVSDDMSAPAAYVYISSGFT